MCCRISCLLSPCYLLKVVKVICMALWYIAANGHFDLSAELDSQSYFFSFFFTFPASFTICAGVSNTTLGRGLTPLTVCIRHSVTNSVTQSFSHSVIQSFSHSVTQSLSHSVTQLLSHLVTLIHSLIQSFSHSLTQSLSHYLITLRHHLWPSLWNPILFFY